MGRPHPSPHGGRRRRGRPLPERVPQHRWHRRRAPRRRGRRASTPSRRTAEWTWTRSASSRTRSPGPTPPSERATATSRASTALATSGRSRPASTATSTGSTTSPVPSPRRTRPSQVLPGFLGGDGPRNYLLVFQNNAEIRATGGIPGSWAELHADDGKLEIVRQGTGGEFGRRDTPVLPLSDGELAVYSDLLGVYFQDATFTPDFPRAAQLMSARWQEKYERPARRRHLPRPGRPVLPPEGHRPGQGRRRHPHRGQRGRGAAQSSLPRAGARAAGRVLRQGRQAPSSTPRLAASPRRSTLSRHRPRRRRTPLLGRVRSPTTKPSAGGHTGPRRLPRTTARPARLHRPQRRDRQQDVLLPALPGRGRVPELRRRLQTLSGTMSLNQTITPAQAEQLPDSVTGAGSSARPRVPSWSASASTDRPAATSATSRSMARRSTRRRRLNGRPVVTLVALLSGPDDVLVTWSMTTGTGPDRRRHSGRHPERRRGHKSSTFSSSC